jgi:hypothetical protein
MRFGRELVWLTTELTWDVTVETTTVVLCVEVWAAEVVEVSDVS